MPVEMIGRKVDQDADRRIKRRREIDLVGRAFDDVKPLFSGRLQRQDRGADIAAKLYVLARAAQEMCDQRRGGRLAVGAGDGHEWGFRREALPLTTEQLDVAYDLHAGILRKLGRPVRLRM